MSNWCFILHKRTLQKLLSVIGITFQMHERDSHTMSFVVVHELTHAHIFLQSRWLWTQPIEMVSCLVISLSLMCLLFGKVICRTHFVIHSGCTSVSGLLLVINICPASMESTVPFLHLCLWYYVFFVSLQWLGINSHWSDTFLFQTKWIRLHSETFERVCSRPAIFKLIACWYNVQCPLVAI